MRITCYALETQLHTESKGQMAQHLLVPTVLICAVNVLPTPVTALGAT